MVNYCRERVNERVKILSEFGEVSDSDFNGMIVSM